MIKSPTPWQHIGQPITLKEIEDTIYFILEDPELCDCKCIAFSGGLDSSLMLYFMAQIHKKIEAFTIGLDAKHPDVIFSKKFARTFPGVSHRIFYPTDYDLGKPDAAGDYIARAFFRNVSNFTDTIIACDGVDEYMAGYYRHQKKPMRPRYYKILRELQSRHLEPLDKNSGDVKVILPYLDDKLILLFSQIPIDEKVDSLERKKIMRALAAGKIPEEIINRRKYGLCDALTIKRGKK